MAAAAMGARRGLLRLGAASALMWAASSMVVAPGSAPLVELSGADAAAGFFLALFYAGAALGSAATGWWYAEHGLAALGTVALGALAIPALAMAVARAPVARPAVSG